MKIRNLFFFCAACLIMSCSTSGTNESSHPVSATDSVQTDTLNKDTVVASDSADFAENLVDGIRRVYKKYGPVKFPFYLEPESDTSCMTPSGTVLGVMADTSKYFDIFINIPAGNGCVCFARVDKKGNYITNTTLLNIDEDIVDMSLCLANDQYFIIQKDLSFEEVSVSIDLWPIKQGGEDFNPVAEDKTVMLKDSARLSYSEGKITGKITSDSKIVYNGKVDTSYFEVDDFGNNEMELHPHGELVRFKEKFIKYDWPNLPDIDAAEILGVKSWLRKNCVRIRPKDAPGF